MGFPKRKWQAFDPIPWQDITNGQWVENPESTKLISNALATHRSALHVIEQTIGLGVPDGSTWDKTFTVEPGANQDILTLPMNRIITGGARRLRAWVLVTRDDGASPAFLWVSAGRNWEKVHLTAGAGVYEWIRLTVDIDPILNPLLLNDLSIQLSCGVDWEYGEGNQEDIHVRSIGMFEPTRLRTRPWVDTSGPRNKLMETDYPLTVAAERILNAKVNAAYGWRVPQNNIYQHCFRTSRLDPLAGTYGSDQDRLGRWMIRKAQGITQINAMLYGAGNVNPVDVKVGLWSYDMINYGAQTVNFVAGDIVRGVTSGAWAVILRDLDSGATGTLWITKPENGPFINGEPLVGDIQGNGTITNPSAGPGLVDSDEVLGGFGAYPYFGNFTFNTRIVSTDAEYEVRVDAKTPGAATRFDLYSLFFDEDLDSDITFDEPNTVHTELDDDVRALTWRKANGMIDHVWNRQRQIILTDRRPLAGEAGQITGKSAAFDTHDVPHGSIRLGKHPFIWAIVYQTPKACRRLRLVFWVSKPNLGSVYTVELNPTVGAITPGDVGTGATSGVTATVLNQTGAAPKSVTFDNGANFILGELINFAPSGATGWVVTTRYFPDNIETKLVARLRVGGAGTIDTLKEVEINTNDLAWNRIHKFEVTIPLGPAYEADKVLHGSGGIQHPFNVQAWGETDNLADYLILHKAICFEEIIPPGGINMSGEDFDR